MFDDNNFVERRKNIIDENSTNAKQLKPITVHSEKFATVVEKRKYYYNLIKYMEVNGNELYLNLEKLKEKKLYEGSPMSDYIVLAGFLRERNNYSKEDFDFMVNKLGLNMQIVKPIIEDLIRNTSSFLFKMMDAKKSDQVGSNNIEMDYNIIELISEEDKDKKEDKKIERSAFEKNDKEFVNKDLFLTYIGFGSAVSDKSEDAIYYSNENTKKIVKVIKKSKIIDFWGEYYSLYIPKYIQFEKYLIKSGFIKYTEYELFVQNKTIESIFESNKKLRKILEKISDDNEILKKEFYDELSKEFYIPTEILDEKDNYYVLVV
jgi:hypothetical protein